jgi:hypothetical protein
MTNRVPETTLEQAVGHAAHRHRHFGRQMCVLPLDQSVSLNRVIADPGALTVTFTAASFSDLSPIRGI